MVCLNLVVKTTQNNQNEIIKWLKILSKLKNFCLYSTSDVNNLNSIYIIKKSRKILS